MAERITLDLTGTEDATKTGGEFKPLEKGWYKVFIYSGEEKETKNDGSPYYRLRLNLAEDARKPGYSGVVFDNFVALYTTQKAPWLAQKAEQLARIAGVWDGVNRAQVVLPTLDDLVGLEVEAFVTKKIDDYAMERYAEDHNDEHPETPIFRNEVATYRPVGGWPDGDDESAPAAKKGKSRITI